MYSDDFILKQVRQQAKAGGASDRRAEEAALSCLSSWKKGAFKGKALAMIDKHIKDAIKATKKDAKETGNLPGI